MSNITSRYSPAMQKALSLVAAMGTTQWVVLPERPSLTMMTAGARAGHVPPGLAGQIYRAMVREGRT